MTSDTFKIVLIGEVGVGKTSIIMQFVDETFQDDIQSSAGGTFCSKTLIYNKNKILNIELWDTAGQERYRSLTKMFYADANAALLVYDITRKETFEEIKNYWADQIKERIDEGVILAIVGNKEDLYEKEEVDENDVINFAKELGAICVKTSAKNQSGINDLFLKIAKKYLGVDDVEIVNEDDSKYEIKPKRSGTVSLKKTDSEKKRKKCC